ncbi:hypothetical protein TrVE_jg13116 [Triparma verrucosa]|uniref:Tox-ART-HYD1 domain-containing protein n=1 Tax=Triparma verrucosa TaxID=1606542 RepID=A0A9W7CN01_9STRA|nr:hypothetical protein TrVE_jg13116 [Triparma verrucosa]
MAIPLSRFPGTFGAWGLEMEKKQEEWMRNATLGTGDIHSQYLLAELYHFNRGSSLVEPSLLLALEWYEKVLATSLATGEGNELWSLNHQARMAIDEILWNPKAENIDDAILQLAKDILRRHPADTGKFGYTGVFDKHGKMVKFEDINDYKSQGHYFDSHGLTIMSRPKRHAELFIKGLGGREVPLYHYTTHQAAEEIFESGELKPSTKAGNNRDAKDGDGIYLTSMPPWADEKLLLKNNYAHAGASTSKLEFYFLFHADEFESRKLSKCTSDPFSDREVYVLQGHEPLVLNQLSLRFGTWPRERLNDEKKPYVLEIVKQKEELRLKEAKLGQRKAVLGLDGPRKLARGPGAAKGPTAVTAKKKKKKKKGEEKKAAPPSPTTAKSAAANGNEAATGFAAKRKPRRRPCGKKVVRARGSSGQ